MSKWLRGLLLEIKHLYGLGISRKTCSLIYFFIVIFFKVSVHYSGVGFHAMFNKKSLAHVKELFLYHYNVMSKHN